MIKALAISLLLVGAATPGLACEPDALGTARVLEVGTQGGGTIGLKSYPRTLPLADGEVVLTFDDGPLPGPTRRVLDALKAECVKATFFLMGRNAAAAPDLVGRIAREGHSIGSHTMTHAILRKIYPESGQREIARGEEAIAKALALAAPEAKLAPFFRFPGFANTPELERWLAARNTVVFGTDVWASDWTEEGANAELALVMRRLRQSKGGILLLHDPRSQTARMLPALLRALKAENYRIVHVVPGSGPLQTKAAPEGWTSETDRTLRKLGIL
jgi:peptidoglycan/xylan/chitin deacetylase (PgdA/CDA1 family)